jgi:hypothetical protein
VTKDEFDSKCRDLCPHCAAGEVVRHREDTNEHVHDWSFGAVDPKTGRKSGFGHGMCGAHALRLKEKDLVDG